MLCNQWELFHLQQQAPNQVFDVQDAHGETAMGDHGGCTSTGVPVCQTAISSYGEGFPDLWDHRISAPFPPLERAGDHKQRFPRRAGSCSSFTIEGSALEPAAAQMAVLLHS